MKIGIFGNVFLQKLTGIGRYVYNLSKYLEVVADRKLEFFVLSNRPIKYNPFKDMKLILEDNSLLRKVPSPLWIRYFSHRYIRKYNIDIIWSPLPYTPKFIPSEVKKIITVYDFNLYIIPESMDYKTYIAYRLFFKKSILEADKIITISEGTAEKLEKYLGRKADKVVKPAVDTNLFNLHKLDDRPFKFNYILSISTLEPRKNIDKLILAFLSLKREGKLKGVKLVLAGKDGWKNEKIKKLIQENKENIIYTGYVEDKFLANLYKYADIFILPSAYEGFGIPVLEARSCGCCVITTDIPELREACGEGCIYIKPTVEDIKIAIEKFYSKNLKCSFTNFKPILWEEEARKLLEVFYKKK